MRHLSPDEIVDAVEGALEPEARRHLSACDACRDSVADLESLLQHTRSVDVAEPSPLFWEQFSTRVRAAIESERSPLGVEPAAPWLRWSVLLPLGAVALLVATLADTVTRTFDPNRVASWPVMEADALVGAATTSADDTPWTFVTEVLGEVTLDDAQRAGLDIAPGVAERALDQLTAAEKRELGRLLRSALARPES
ncbi:MAG: hypothetical protein ABR606_08940 [Vicinamibacterales bacterium]